MIKLEISIRDANIQKHHLIAVFFDMVKAYNTTWSLVLMKELDSMWLRGRLPNIINIFFSDRKFRLWVGTIFSNLH